MQSSLPSIPLLFFESNDLIWFILQTNQINLLLTFQFDSALPFLYKTQFQGIIPDSEYICKKIFLKIE